MSTEGLETVGLDLGGNFAAKAREDAAAGNKLVDTLAKIGKGTSVSIDDGAINKALGKIREGTSKIGGGGGTFANLFSESQLFGKLSGIVGRVFGPGARGQLEKGAASISTAADDLGVSPAMLAGAGKVVGTGAGALLAAGVVVAAAAAAIGVAAIKLGKAGYEIAVEETSKREIQQSIFDSIGHGGGYEVAIKLAAKYNLPEDEAVSQVKGLLAAKFSEQEVPLIVKLAVGIGAVEGQDKGAAFIDEMKKVQNTGTFDQKAVKGFAGAGVDATKVYEELAKKLGVSMDVAKAKVKAGQVSVKDGLDAVEKAADSQFGGVAAKMADSVPALLAVVASDAKHLFDSVDLGPIKDFLKTLDGVLKGPSGEALKSSINELFSSINEAFLSQFKGEEGKQKLETFFKAVGTAIHDVAGAVKDLRPLIEAMTTIGGTAIIGGIRMVAIGAQAIADGFNTLVEARDTVLDFIDSLEALLGIGDQVGQGGTDMGNALVDGFADAISGGASRAINAAEQMAADALAAAKSLLGVASPSKEFQFLGNMSAEGFAGAMSDHPGPEKAGAQMADAALSGAAGAGAPGGGAGGGGGGMVVHFAPNIHLPAGSSAETQAAAKAGVAAGLPEFEALLRRTMRDGMEAAA